jgi:hypothetical protein
MRKQVEQDLRSLEMSLDSKLDSKLGKLQDALLKGTRPSAS